MSAYTEIDHGRLFATIVAVFLLSVLSLGDARAQAPQLTYYPALELQFLQDSSKNFFLSQSWVVNSSGKPMTDMVLTQRFPKGFTAELPPDSERVRLKLPEGSSHSLEGNVYTLKLPELRIAEATALLANLSYKGRPGSVEFPGTEVEYTQDGERHKEKGPDLTWDISKYTRYSGTIEDFIKRYALLDLDLPSGQWGFSSAASRSAGKIPTGVVDIESGPGERLRFSVEAGEPGNLRQMMVTRRAYNPARKLTAQHEVRQYVEDLVKTTAEFTLDVDEMVIRQEKLGELDAWVVDTRWHDRVKDRLGSGPSRWYIFLDDDEQFQYVINISAQALGSGAANLESPKPEKEDELMAEMAQVVKGLRIL